MRFLKTLILGTLVTTSLTTTALANEADIIGNNFEHLQTLQISTPGDLELSCGALSEEAASMGKIIHAAQDVKNNSELKSHGITAAGAIGSFLIGSATGGIGLAVGGFLMNHSIEERSDQADNMQDIAAQRRTLMMGIHNAKGCFGPIEHAMQNPEEFNPIGALALSDQPKYYADLRKRYND